MFFGNFYENGYLYWFVVHNLQTKISGKLLVVPGRYTALSTGKKMVTILHRELERKVEKVKLDEVGGHAAKDQKQYELPAWINHYWSW